MEEWAQKAHYRNALVKSINFHLAHIREKKADYLIPHIKDL